MENQLLGELQKNNAFAQKRVYDRFVNRMFRLCLRYVRQEEDAREVLMNGFLKFFKTIQRVEYRGENTLEPYLKQIMVNEALMFLRQRRTVWVSLEEAETTPNPATAPDVDFDAEALFGLVLRLPTGYRTVFNLFALEGYSHAEIATQLGISEGTSKSQLNKARTLLQKMLKKSGYDHARRNG
ncbi:MAG: sigma-70 family RNA polymerase sigma factor [Cytophagaceae bacterium]|nr:sigma-70 family RNA polymerase sigma factor [Cytophagaceae bacterium]